MLALNFGNWYQWAPYDPASGFFGDQKVTFDGINKLILVADGVTSLNVKEDVYSAWKEWQLIPNEHNSKFEPAFRAIGGDPISGGRNLGVTYFLINGWRMRTWEGDHRLLVDGNIFTEEGEKVFVETVSNWNTEITFNVSNLVDELAQDDIPVILQTVSEAPTVHAQTLLDLVNGIETDITLRQALRIMVTMLGGKVTGAGTGTETFRDINDAKNRAVVTVDSQGNRTDITWDVD